MATPSSESSGPAALEVAETAVPVGGVTTHVCETDETETGSDATSSDRQNGHEQQPTPSPMSLEKITVLFGVTYLFLVACLYFFYVWYQDRSYANTWKTYAYRYPAARIHYRVSHDSLAVHDRRYEETEVTVIGGGAVWGSPCDAHEESGSPLQTRVGVKATELDPDNFRRFVERDGFAFVAFNAPWCIWSQRMTPVWHDFAAEVEREGIPVRIATVDCFAHADLCRGARITAFPTMRWYRDGKPSVETYRQDRTVVGFMEFARRKMDEPEEIQVAHSMLRGVHETYGEILDDDVTEWIEMDDDVTERIEAKEVRGKIEESVVHQEESFFQEEDLDDMAVNRGSGGVHEPESVHSAVNKAEASENEVIGTSALANDNDKESDDEEYGVFDFDVSKLDPGHGENA